MNTLAKASTRSLIHTSEAPPGAIVTYLMPDDDADDVIARAQGFDDAKDLFACIAAVDISTPQKRADFKAWQGFDGTKAGLLALPTVPHVPK